MKIKLTYGITRYGEWAVTPRVEEYFHEEQALQRYIELKKKMQANTEKLVRLFDDHDYKYQVFSEVYNDKDEYDAKMSYDFFCKAYDRLGIAELSDDVPCIK